MGWGPDLQNEIQDAEKPEAGQHGCWEHQKARLKVLPGEDWRRQQAGNRFKKCAAIVLKGCMASIRMNKQKENLCAGQFGHNGEKRFPVVPTPGIATASAARVASLLECECGMRNTLV